MMSIITNHPKDLELLQLAHLARERAYVPYSNFAVGAAILTRSGEVVTGCNVENASYSLCICAERTAVTKAVSENLRDFEAIAIATKTGAMPCGACRQVLAEFGGPNGDLRIIVSSDSGSIRSYTIAELLPNSFSSDQISDL